MRHCLTTIALVAAAVIPGCARSGDGTAPPRPTRHEDLVVLFTEWRAFQPPKRVDGVPDYSRAAMAEQYRGLLGFQERLAAFDTTGWSVADQVDWHVVRAEMNGLDFDHRVLRPWASNPAFYVTAFGAESDQPAREGPFSAGGVELWASPLPLSADDAARIDSALRIIPRLLDRARETLTGSGHDLWERAIASLREQSADLEHFSAQLGDAEPEVRASAQRAREATDAFAGWVEAQLPQKTGPSGVGVADYDWYLRHVQLVPYTWAEEVLLMERELARAWATLALEERRNASLPAPVVVASAAEHRRRFSTAVTEYIAFLRDREIMTVRDYMDPALRERVGTYRDGPREFFTEIDYRDPVVMRTHGYHWFDKGRLAHLPHASPIRQGALLYNIFNTRTEGLATAWEELMMHAGLFDGRPRSRELIYILVAQRAARALGDLRMHANEQTLEQAAAFTAANTPRGWLSLQGTLVRGEQHLYLQQPGYGTSYMIGKLQLDDLLRTRRRQLGDAFTMRDFVDALDAAGHVPASLLHWELTGELPERVRRMLQP